MNAQKEQRHELSSSSECDEPDGPQQLAAGGQLSRHPHMFKSGSFDAEGLRLLLQGDRVSSVLLLLGCAVR